MLASLVDSIESWGRKHSLSRRELDALVDRAAAENAADAKSYKRQVLLFSLLGYGFIFLIVGSILASTVALIVWAIVSHQHSYGVGKLILLLLVTNVLLLISLWVKNPAPSGIRLNRQDCPELFSLIDELCKMQKVKIDQVMLDYQMNAYVSQLPRLGILGWPKNYLVIGYPYMASRSPLMFKATLAHELGHISGSHGKTGAWAYTVSNMYGQLLASLREGSPLLYCIFYAFLHWYTPRFSAYSFVLRRQHEYEADRMSIELTSAEAASLDLISLSIYARALSEIFWPELNRLAASMPNPPDDLMARMKDFFNKGFDENQAQKWYQEDLMLRTETSDTHPSLMDRLIFAGYPAKTPEEVRASKLSLNQLLISEPSAAAHYLGLKDEHYQQQVSRLWYEEAELNWQAAHQSAIESNKALAELEAKQAEGVELEKNELVSLASLTYTVHGKAKALPLVESIVARYPDSSWANLVLGYERLTSGDESGIELLEKAMKVDVARLPDACDYLIWHFKRNGDYERAETYLQRVDQFDREANLAINERLAMPSPEQLVEPGLSQNEIEALQAALSQIKELKSACIARRQVQYLKDIPCYVLGVQFKAGLDLEGDRHARLIYQLSTALSFEHDLRIFLFNDKLSKHASALPSGLLMKA